MTLQSPPSPTEILERDNRTGKFTGKAGAVWVKWFGELVQVLLQLILTRGVGSPETFVSGSPGDLYVSTSGGAGTTLYVKESGVNSTTGWVAK